MLKMAILLTRDPSLQPRMVIISKMPRAKVCDDRPFALFTVEPPWLMYTALGYNLALFRWIAMAGR